MKKSEPKLILNLNLDGSELEEKIQIAVDKYIEDVVQDGRVDSKLFEVISKYADKRLDAILMEKRWDNSSLINGRMIGDHIEKLASPKVEAVIDRIIQKLISERIGGILGGN